MVVCSFAVAAVPFAFAEVKVGDLGGLIPKPRPAAGKYFVPTWHSVTELAISIAPLELSRPRPLTSLGYLLGIAQRLDDPEICSDEI